MRAVLVEILLALVVAFCLAFLLISGSLGLDRIVLAGIGLLLVSSLFAAISALGPKYEPTPFLTPMMAGTMTAIIATTLVFASTTRLPQADNALRDASEPASMQASMEPIEIAPDDSSMADAPSVRTVEPANQQGDDFGAMSPTDGTMAQPTFGAESSPLLAPTPMEQVEEDVFVSELPEDEGSPFDEAPPLDDASDFSALQPPPAEPPPPTEQPPTVQQAEPPPTQLVQQAPQPAAPDPNAPLQLNPAIGGGTASPAPAQTPALIPPLPRIRPR